MKHRKEYHSDKVPSCNAVNTGSCRYGEKKCWFKHSKKENNINDFEEITETDKNSEMLQKLFEMVEKYTNKINLLENEIKELKSEI